MGGWNEALHPRGEHGEFGAGHAVATAVADARGPDRKALKTAVSHWTTSTEHSQKIQRGLIAGFQGKKMTGHAAVISDALRSSRPEAPELWRGMSWHAGEAPRAEAFKANLKPGQVIDLPPASFSESRSQAETFTPAMDNFEPRHGVLFQVEPGSYGLNTEGLAAKRFGFQKEWISGGRYEVTHVEPLPVSAEHVAAWRQYGMKAADAKQLAAKANEQRILVHLRQVQGFGEGHA